MEQEREREREPDDDMDQMVEDESRLEPKKGKSTDKSLIGRLQEVPAQSREINKAGGNGTPGSESLNPSSGVLPFSPIPVPMVEEPSASEAEEMTTLVGSNPRLHTKSR